MTEELYNYMPEDPKIGCLGSTIGILIAMFICALLNGCKAPCGITEKTALHDTTYITAWKSDSVFVHDSIYTEKVLKGDTVLIYKYKEMVKWQEKKSVDTLYISKTDTVKVTKTEQVEKKLTALEQMKMHLGGICLWALMLAVGINIWRWYKGK